MKIEEVPFCTTKWDEIAPTQHPGITGMAYWRTFEQGNIRVRLVEYTPGYEADHWCSRGHVLFVLEGELFTRLQDGREFCMTPGMSYQVAENSDPPPLAYCKGRKTADCGLIFIKTLPRRRLNQKIIATPGHIETDPG